MDSPKLLKFPCDYPIKVMIRTEAEVRAAVDAAFATHAGAAVVAKAVARASAQGNFTSVTYLLHARDEAHVAELFADLKLIPGVLMVL